MPMFEKIREKETYTKDLTGYDFDDEDDLDKFDDDTDEEDVD